MHKCIHDGFSRHYRINIKTRRCSEDPDNLRYVLITFVLRFTSVIRLNVIWVLRKPTREFLAYATTIRHQVKV